MDQVGLDILQTLQGDWEHINRIIPYGFGSEFRKRIHRLLKDFNIPYILDGDEKKWGQYYGGIEVISPQGLRDFQTGDKVLICLAGRARKAYQQIVEKLKSYGLEENKDFCALGQFEVEWYYRYRHEYCLYMVDMALTTACTLKCKHCNMFVPYYVDPIMISYEEAKSSIDLLMNRIDYLFGLGFLGGEAFLNPILEPLLYYVRKVYSQKIGMLSITTNGVVLPSAHMLDVLKTNDVNIEISDYTDAIGDRSHVDELVALLAGKNISYGVLYNRVWCDTGFPRAPKNISDGEVKEHMLHCNGWRGLNDGKYFFCNTAWSAEKTGRIHLQEGDYIDLALLPLGKESTKRKILEFSLGKLPNDYMSFCKVCGGCGPDNQKFVLAGEQM